MKKFITIGLIAGLSLLTATADNKKMPTPAAPELHPFITKAAKSTDNGLIKLSRVPNRAKAHDVPFIEDFSNPSSLNDWYIQDVNNDGDSWEYDSNNQLLKCYFSSRGIANNDWVITPAINLGADDIYTLTFSYGSQGSRFSPEHLTVTMGKSEYGTQHTTVLFDDAQIQNFWNGSMITTTITLPVDEDGAYYFGFHCTSPNSSYCLYLDDIKVEQNGSYAAPEAITDLTIVPGEKGALSATVSFTAPTKTADGKNITTALDNVTVYRDGTLVKTFDSPTAGEKLSFTDTGMVNGLHTYTAVASLSGLEGAKAECSAFIGVDTPLAIENVKATETDNGIELTWDAPLGQNGGYVGSDVVKYTILRIDGDDESTLTTNGSETTYLDTTLSNDSQIYVYYIVYASTATGSSAATESNAVFYGPAYTIPFAESFAYCELKKSPWVMEFIKSGIFESSWYLTAMGSSPLCPPIDGDDGMALFQATSGYMNLYQGNEIRLSTPAISLENTNEPFISFYLFHYDTSVTTTEYDQENEEYYTSTTTYNDKLRLQISTDNGDYTDIPGTEIYLNANNGGWTQYTFPLSAYKNAGKISIGLVGYADGGGNICVDKLLITDKFDADMEVTGLYGPQTLNEGQTAEYICNILNNGTSSTKDYTVSLYLDDELIDTQKGPGAAIFANGGEKTIRFSFTPRHKDTGAVHELYARVNYSDDQCPANDTSEVIMLDVPANNLPRVENLTGSDTNGTIELTWDEPQMTGIVSAATDDIESYTPFAISGIGSYYLIDNDKSKTYCIDGIQSYDNAGAAMAWQVFHPELAGLDIEIDFNQRWRARSGSQYLISWGAAEADSNDDWLISPQLSGEQQTISFYIKSVTMAYAERFRVLYSTDSRSISDFVKVGDPNYYTPNSKWRKFSATLPEGAKYFAIQCISADGFGIMVDDINFTPYNATSVNYEFNGYNVYRDGEKINTTPLAEAFFTDTPADNSSHTYTVTALYRQGESSPSSPWSSAESSVGNIENGHIDIRSLKSAIAITGFTGHVSVYGIDGQVLIETDMDENHVFSVNPGFYVVCCGNHVAKVLVK